MHLDATTHSHFEEHFPPLPMDPADIGNTAVIGQKENKTIFKVENYSFSYGKIPILHNISFEITKGTVCGILGPNGSGKTTLFRCCMNFQKSKQGEILLNDTSIHRMKPQNLAKKMAYVPQEHQTAFTFTVREMVQMGRTAHMSVRLSRHDKEQSEQAMERLGVQNLANNAFQELSGGQRQLVLIARAVAQASEIILLDEPTSALDFHNQVMVWNVLRSLAREGHTILTCCHDPNHILWFCDQVLVLKNGKIITDGNPVQCLNTDILRQIYGDDCSCSYVKGVPLVHPTFSDH